MADDVLAVRDALEADMAGHEARHGEVHAARNQQMAAEALESYERQAADIKPAKPEPMGSAPIERTVEKRATDRGEYTITREVDKPMFRTASEFETQVLAHAQPRIALLMSKQDSGPLGTPSWRSKTLAAMYFKVKSLEAKAAKQVDLETYYELAYQQDLEDLLESSNQIFGDWRKPIEKPLLVQV